MAALLIGDTPASLCQSSIQRERNGGLVAAVGLNAVDDDGSTKVTLSISWDLFCLKHVLVHRDRDRDRLLIMTMLHPTRSQLRWFQTRNDCTSVVTDRRNKSRITRNSLQCLRFEMTCQRPHIVSLAMCVAGSSLSRPGKHNSLSNLGKLEC